MSTAPGVLAESIFDPKVCEQCSRQGLTCCQASESGLEMRFPLSPSEIEMLRPFAAGMNAPWHLLGPSDDPSGENPSWIQPGGRTDGQDVDWFYAQVLNTKYFVDSLRVLFPGEAPEIRQLYPVGRKRAVLAVIKPGGGAQPANGSCVFLGAAGCVLPRQVRPWHCKLFPLWSARGKPRLLDVETCLAVRQASAAHRNHDKRLEELLRMLHTDLNGFQELYKGLRTAWGLGTGHL